MLDTSTLSDSQLVEWIGADRPAPRAVIDEYYRRCIPLYLNFLGIHWHTGFYQEGDVEPSAADLASYWARARSSSSFFWSAVCCCAAALADHRCHSTSITV